MSAIKMPTSILLNIPAWQAETSALTAAERGALLSLKMYFWRSGPIPDRDQSLAQITGMELKDWKKARKAIEPLFLVGEGEWIRVEWCDELEVAYEAIRKASNAGKTANKARWNREKRSSESDTKRIRSASESDTSSVLNIKSAQTPTPKAPSQGKDVFRAGDHAIAPEWSADLQAAESAFLAGGVAAATTEQGGRV